MPLFHVLHTDPKLHPLEPSLIELLQSAGAAVIPLAAGMGEYPELAGRADAVLNADFQLTAELIRRLARCRIISRFGTGVDNIDVPCATSQGIVVANVPDFCTDEVANRAITLLLACACRLVQLDLSLRRGEWRSSQVPATVQIEGQTLGLVGFGKIARAVARRARPLGLKLVAFDPYVAESTLMSEGVSLADLDTLLATSDFISIHAPLTPATHHLINRRAFSLIKPTAVLVNCSRGGLIDEAAMIAALRTGTLAGAGLDVFEREPLPADSPLLVLDQVIVTPHTAAHTEAALRKVRRIAVENVLQALTGQEVKNAINPVAARR